MTVFDAESMLRRKLQRAASAVVDAPQTETYDFSGELAMLALLLIEKNPKIMLDTILPGKGVVGTTLKHAHKDSLYGFRMANLPMMAGPVHSPLSVKSEAFTLYFHRGLLKCSYGDKLPGNRWLKETAFLCIFPRGFDAKLDWATFKTAVSTMETVSVRNIEIMFRYGEIRRPLEVGRVVISYEDILRGARNIGVHPSHPRKGKPTANKLIGWLLYAGPWAVRIYLNALACHLAFAVGRAVGVVDDFILASPLTSYVDGIVDNLPESLWLVCGPDEWGVGETK